MFISTFIYLHIIYLKCFAYLGQNPPKRGENIQVKKLSEISEIHTGVRLNRLKEKNTSLKKVIKKISSENILEYEYTVESVPNSINGKFISQKNDIIISLLDPGSVCKLEKEGLVIPMQFAIIRLKEGYNPDYVYHFLDSIVFHKKLHILLEGGALKIIKVADLKNIEIYIPELEKQ